MKDFLIKTALFAALALLPAVVPAQDESVPSPEPRTAGELTYLSGGVGIDEREAMRAQMGDYNLRLKFAAVGGAYLGKVMVKIEDRHGRLLLETESDGPWLFVKMPKGKYRLIVENDGDSQARNVDLSKKAVADEVFRWKVPQNN